MKSDGNEIGFYSENSNLFHSLQIMLYSTTLTLAFWRTLPELPYGSGVPPNVSSGVVFGEVVLVWCAARCSTNSAISSHCGGERNREWVAPSHSSLQNWSAKFIIFS